MMSPQLPGVYHLNRQKRVGTLHSQYSKFKTFLISQDIIEQDFEGEPAKLWPPKYAGKLFDAED